MTDIPCTHHAESRLQQRGIRKKDILLIIGCGTRIDDETWMMRKKDADREIASRKREIQRLKHLAQVRAKRSAERFPPILRNPDNVILALPNRVT